MAVGTCYMANTGNCRKCPLGVPFGSAIALWSECPLGVREYEPRGAMPPRKRPSAAEQEPHPIGSPRKQGPSTPPGKQREERRAEWKTQRRQVIKVPGGAMLRGCKKTKHKLMAHFQLRAGVHQD
ncbi:hypothetical protein HaLaN_15634 [Haematococcus lacustris]|uniref:Uncharacterized protein n=1 Tax=Haematococcus lacustris TaxID=44745 RepID=A0A699Z7Z5_HAELA|nr:hypothetical protein HaLaN_15634 [Haematococcus lacustris]